VAALEEAYPSPATLPAMQAQKEKLNEHERLTASVNFIFRLLVIRPTALHGFLCDFCAKICFMNSPIFILEPCS